MSNSCALAIVPGLAKTNSASLYYGDGALVALQQVHLASCFVFFRFVTRFAWYWLRSILTSTVCIPSTGAPAVLPLNHGGLGGRRRRGGRGGAQGLCLRRQRRPHIPGGRLKANEGEEQGGAGGISCEQV